MKLNVLIAEAEEELTEAICTQLLVQECDVRIARSGVECLELVRRFSPQVLVLAEELLWGGGCGVLACLRESTLGYRLSVILTATPLNEHRLSPAAPVVACLLKPFPLVSLLRSIEQAARSSQYNVVH